MCVCVCVCVCVCPYFNVEQTKFLGNGMILNPVTYKQLLNSTNASALKQMSKFIGLTFSKFVYIENIERDVILVRENVVTRSGRTIICPTRLDLKFRLAVMTTIIFSHTYIRCNMFRLGAVTTSSGKEFQTSTTLWLKKCFRRLRRL